MTGKQLMIIILIASFSLTFIIIAIVGIYKYQPQVLGFPPNPQDTIKVDSIYIPKTINISEKKLSDLEKNIIDKANLKQQKDSLWNEKKRLIDSISRITKIIANYKDTVKNSRWNLSQSSKTISFLYDSLNNLHQKYKQALDKNDLAKKRIDDQEKFINRKQDTVERMNFETFAKLYSNTDPTKVAKILEQIDERDAAKIIKMLPKKKAGKVLEAMIPERAAAILLLGGSE